MEKTVKNCWNCPFLSFVSGEFYCEHMDIDSNGFLVSEYSLGIIHPNCPEGGEFVITTKKLDNGS